MYPCQKLQPLPVTRRQMLHQCAQGVSAMDSFDPKPLLTKEHGQKFKMKMEPTQFNNNGSTLGSPWEFKNYGQSGLPVSDLFPHIASCADDLALIRSMTSN